MMHGFARNATFWNRWVPAIAESHRVYRPDLLGCGLADQPPKGYRYTPHTISAQILAVLEALSLPRVHWVGIVTETEFGPAARWDRLLHGSALLFPTSLPAADHPARGLALSPVHTELPGCRGAPR